MARPSWVARVTLVPIRRIGAIRVAPGVMLGAMTTVARVGLSALVAVVTVAALAVVTGRPTVPMQALSAARVVEVPGPHLVPSAAA